MRLLVGLTKSDLSGLDQSSAQVSSGNGAVVFAVTQPFLSAAAEGSRLLDLPAEEILTLTAHSGTLSLQAGTHASQSAARICIDPRAGSVTIPSLKRGGKHPAYHGKLCAWADGNKVRLILETNLEDYIKGVLQSEIPATYHAEAIKAQAVTARTYALNPRISHLPDDCNVCDSYLCCQYFAGLEQISAHHAHAIESTSGQIVTFASKPILALFSSSAGGHTENYENCFSDPITGAFPPDPLPYLKGVPEGKLPAGYGGAQVPEKALRVLFATEHPATDDSWASQFRWSAHLPANAIESNMHHTLSKFLQDKEMAPFVVPPDNRQFGMVKRLEVTSRGVAGTAIELAIQTSKGTWTVKKELVIRSAFHAPELSLARLRSARIFFDHHFDSNGLLASVDVHGLGFGHGVGLQQTGAQGLALSGRKYTEIIQHYFSGAYIEKV